MRGADLQKHILILLGLGIGGSAMAQQKDTLSVHDLGEVIVQENRLAAPLKASNRNITIISRKQIDAMAVSSINEVLAFVPGVDVRQRGPWGIQADIGIDGGTFDQTLVLLNGIKITDAQTGHNMMNLPVLLSDVDHIEVLRGAAAHIYGINALNGAINIITRKAASTGVTINGSLGSSFRKNEKDNLYGSYGGGVSGSLVTRNSNQTLSASANAGNGYRYNTAYDNYRAFYQGTFTQDSAHQYNVLAGFVKNSYGANAFYAAPGDKESEESVKTFLAAVSNTSRITRKWVMTPRISYRYTEDDYRYIKQNKSSNLHDNNILSAELNNSFETSIGSFGAGVEGRYEYINSNNLGNHNRTNVGIYGEYKSKADRRFNFSIGGYLNYNSAYGWQFFPGANAGFNVTRDLKLFANAGTSQRLPTYTDLYYKNPAIIGNDQLGAERAFYGEAGVRKYSGKFTFSGSAFFRQITDFIDYVKDSLPQPWQPQNLQRANTTGFSLNAGYSTAFNSGVFNNFSANAGYNYLSPEFKGVSYKISRYVIESLRHQITANVQTSLLQHFMVSASARYNMRINYKDYTVVDARIAYRLPRYQVYVDANNLLDVTYIEAGAVPMPGRWLTLGASVRL
ncbi:MAG TPA: TonB-dependent receptor [Chitinophaga sp.]|uniref:TonB-dependent receptor plug domain-containing protein n=1 Tax=Chitinophaga sp. TaxID=1869181 RepID=UPI002B5F3455|nr:TonB-dependent receptor [Chitinophaga sp.]HVI45771.1 TonB-dependent receptor [Chitinophaga sp.]